MPAHEPSEAASVPAVPVPAAAPAPVSVVAQAVAPRKRAEHGLTTAQLRVSVADEAAFAAIERELGGRAHLVSILGSTQFPKAEATVVGMIADPENDAVSLAKVCALGGIPLARLLKMFKEAALARGQLLSISKIAEKLPDVAAAVMEDAIPGDRPCATCNGLGQVMASAGEDAVPVAAQCPNCKGRGLIRFYPDHDVQKTALQLGGLLQKGGNITQIVAQQNNGGGAVTSTDSFDTIVSALDKVIYGEGRERFTRSRPSADQEEVIDAEVDDPPAEGAEAF